MRSAEDGFSLLELVAVLAIFSTVAIMSLDALSGSLRTRERLAEDTRQVSEVLAVMALLRRDVEAMAALSSAASPDPSFRATASGIEFFAELGEPAAISRIEWTLSDGALVRRLVPARAGGPVEETARLPGVAGWNAVVLAGSAAPVDARGWRATAPDDLPAGLDLRFRVDGFGPVQVVAVR